MAASSSPVAPGISMHHRDASSRSANVPGVAGTTATMSSPGGSAASSPSRTASGSHSRVSPISRNSASLAAPVGAALAYEIFGCGVKPEE